MELTDILVAVRELYLEQFDFRIRSLRDENRSLIIEPPLRNHVGELAVEGSLQLPMRVDLYDSEVGCLSVDRSTTLSFAPQQFIIHNSVRLDFKPFCWDACNITIPQNFNTFLERELAAWFFRWFDSEKEDPINSTGMLGVIHFLSDPTTDSDNFNFQVDFGSSPVTTLKELLDVLISQGVDRISID